MNRSEESTSLLAIPTGRQKIINTTMKTIASKLTPSIAVISAFALHSLPVSAATIFQDTFSDTGALNGSAPDVTTGGATWSASGWQQDGTIAGRSTSGADSAWLPFAPDSGLVYTLTAVMGQETAGSVLLSGSWMAIGFSASNTTSTFFGDPNNTSPWALHRAPGSHSATPNEVVSFTGPGTGGSNAAHDPFAGAITLSIVLDTTQPQWKATWFEGSNQLREYTYAVGENPDISFVGFGRSNRSVGPIESFEFTAIPEPSSAILAGGFGFLVLLRRRRG